MTDTVIDDDTAPGFDIARLGADRLLTLFGGISAIGFGALALVLVLMDQTVPGPAFAGGYTLVGGAIFSFAVSTVFGLALLMAYTTMMRRPAEGAILGLAFSVILLAFGSTPGLIGGIVGLVGSLVGIVRNMKFVA